MKKGQLVLLVFLSVVFSVVSVSALRADFAIYDGAGTWEPSKTAFKSFLEWKGLTWELVNKNTINYGGLTGNYRGLFMPGGWAGDYNRDIKPSGDQHIRNFISQGGAYIGMSAGAFYACDVTIWEGNVYDYPSDIFDGNCIGPIDEIAPWPNYVMTTMNINQQHEANAYEPAQRDVLYYGEPYFTANSGQEMQVFARWIVPTNQQAHDAPGIIGFNYGQGRVLLVGPHPEIEEDSARDGTNFADELSDGADGSDWPFIWTGVDWILHQGITQRSGTQPMQCNGGADNDLDGFVDYPADIGCLSVSDNDETDPVPTQCSDGVDNDGDSFIDLSDAGCVDANDNDETDPTGPVDLLFDDFEDGVLDGWTLTTVENNWYVGTSNPYQGTRYAEAKPMNTNEPASNIERGVSTTGYASVEFSYYRRLIGLDVGDEFKVKWFDGGAWNILEQTGSGSVNDASYVQKTFVLPGNAGNNPNFKIRFECTAGAVSEFCRVDNVRVIGQ